jgi:hypothetical protein
MDTLKVLRFKLEFTKFLFYSITRFKYEYLEDIFTRRCFI